MSSLDLNSKKYSDIESSIVHGMRLSRLDRKKSLRHVALSKKMSIAQAKFRLIAIRESQIRYGEGEDEFGYEKVCRRKSFGH